MIADINWFDEPTLIRVNPLNPRKSASHSSLLLATQLAPPNSDLAENLVKMAISATLAHAS